MLYLLSYVGICSFNLERETGFEPATTGLEGQCSTPELLPLLVEGAGFEPAKASAGGFTVPCLWPLGYPSTKAGGGIRTPDLLITNQLLYQLSYASSHHDTRGKMKNIHFPLFVKCNGEAVRKIDLDERRAKD